MVTVLYFWGDGDSFVTGMTSLVQSLIFLPWYLYTFFSFTCHIKELHYCSSTLIVSPVHLHISFCVSAFFSYRPSLSSINTSRNDCDKQTGPGWKLVPHIINFQWELFIGCRIDGLLDISRSWHGSRRGRIIPNAFVNFELMQGYLRSVNRFVMGPVCSMLCLHFNSFFYIKYLLWVLHLHFLNLLLLTCLLFSFKTKDMLMVKRADRQVNENICATANRGFVLEKILHWFCRVQMENYLLQ